MTRLSLEALMLATALGLIAMRPVRGTATDVTGVWRTAEARDASGRDITDRGQRTTFIFTRRHFSISWSDITRPEFRPPLSDSQRVAMWQGFGAQAGTYEISGDTLILHSEIAKSPQAMARGAFQKLQVQQQGRMIWLQLVADNSGALPNQERIRLFPLE